MGIGPIANLSALLAVRPQESVLEPLPMSRVENSSRAGDDSYSPGGGKSARGSEDNEPDDDDTEIPAAEQSDPSPYPRSTASSRKISFFA